MRKLSIAFLLTIILACSLINLSVAAQKPVVKKIAVLKIDSSDVNLRKLDTAKVNNYLKKAEFSYQEKDKPKNLWSKFWDWLWRIIYEWFNNKEDSKSTAQPGLIVQYMLFALAIGLILWFIIKIAGIDNIFNRRAKQVEVPYTEVLENIHDISFKEQIEKAVTAGNYRMAVRLLYLQSLKQLNDANLITWQIEKTNMAYLDELKDATQKQNFRRLTYQFEFVWYGGFAVNKSLYEDISTQFYKFSTTLG
jgi:ABC-type transport system involved in multi-copper enzyme maturation permease subunit